jgi:hypothetical protein
MVAPGRMKIPPEPVISPPVHDPPWLRVRSNDPRTDPPLRKRLWIVMF